MKDDQLIIKSITNNVGSLLLNRPRTLNAFNLPLAESFIRAIEQFGADASVRAVVIGGEGKVFSAGGDISEMSDNVKSGDRAAYFREPLTAFGRMCLAVRRCPKPVLASVHGAVAGVAFNLVLHCDLKIAAADTRFTQAFVRIGLCPDGGGTYLLPRLVGYARSCELAMLPTVIDAETAREWGLINRVVASENLAEETEKLARSLAEGPTGAIARMKELFYAREIAELTESMEAERHAQIVNADTEDFVEGLCAFIEKRKPLFTGK